MVKLSSQRRKFSKLLLFIRSVGVPDDFFLRHPFAEGSTKRVTFRNFD